MLDNQQINDLLGFAEKKMNQKQGDINNENTKNAINSMLSKLSKEDMQKVQGVLNDKEATEKLLNSPQAKMLLKKLKDSGKK